MKLLIFSAFLLFSQFAFPQEIPPDLLKKMEKTGEQKSLADSIFQYNLTANKGRLTFTNGETARFNSLKLENDSVNYRSPSRKIHKIPLPDVNLITEFHPHRGENALVGGIVGLATGLLAGYLAYPEENTLTTIFQLLFSDEETEGPKLSKKAIPLIIGSTAAGALIGTFVISKKDQEVIYRKKEVTISLVPEISGSPDVHPGYRMTARIRF